MSQSAYLLVNIGKRYQIKVDNSFNRIRFVNKIIICGTYKECAEEKLLMETYF